MELLAFRVARLPEIAFRHLLKLSREFQIAEGLRVAGNSLFDDAQVLLALRDIVGPPSVLNNGALDAPVADLLPLIEQLGHELVHLREDRG